MTGINQGSCFRINHFPDDNDYDTDSSEYLLRKLSSWLVPEAEEPLGIYIFQKQTHLVDLFFVCLFLSSYDMIQPAQHF